MGQGEVRNETGVDLRQSGAPGAYFPTSGGEKDFVFRLWNSTWEREIRKGTFNVHKNTEKGGH